MEPQMCKDPAGFPMIQVEPRMFVHWLPVTKIQFEHFLCDAHDRSFDAGWYDRVLELNPRVTPKKITRENYWNAFMSGLLPTEAQRFAFWCGDGYRLPSAAEWARIYQFFSAQPAMELDRVKGLNDLPTRIGDLVQHTEAAGSDAARQLGYERRLADQMLMRLGVLEWVSAQERWGAMGEPFPDLCGNLLAPEIGEPVFPRQPPDHPEIARLPCFGFRLIFVEGNS
jgi:hypothetical protein